MVDLANMIYKLYQIIQLLSEGILFTSTYAYIHVWIHIWYIISIYMYIHLYECIMHIYVHVRIYEYAYITYRILGCLNSSQHNTFSLSFRKETLHRQKKCLQLLLMLGCFAQSFGMCSAACCWLVACQKLSCHVPTERKDRSFRMVSTRPKTSKDQLRSAQIIIPNHIMFFDHSSFFAIPTRLIKLFSS